ncbi:MAG: hypothetical protein OHK0024_11000 [Thalassobaculales bacterium]
MRHLAVILLAALALAGPGAPVGAAADSLVLRDAEGRRIERLDASDQGRRRVILRDAEGRRSAVLAPAADRPAVVILRDPSGRRQGYLERPAPP